MQTPHRAAPSSTPGTDAFTAIIAATCVMVILTPIIVWLVS
jgi:hypothetical protein